MTALLFAVAWLIAAVGVGVVIGRAIRAADKAEAVKTVEPLYVPQEWVA